ncbi:short chain dehydrogenase [Undibacterium sp. TJN25]|uniref:short chain dehydrogenase n=1 Tax=Undibacterium sp. TJN25 TaxID=3413056 RepID=UPI003BF1CFBA
MKKILVIGAGGAIGKAVVSQLEQRHQVIKVGKNRGEHQADITDMDSVRTLLEKVGKVDGIVLTAGQLHFGPLQEMTPELFAVGLQDKLMGQVNVVLAGQDYLSDGGSFTLTSGIVGNEPILYGANATTVNAAIEGFARAAAIELKRGLRINVVNPSVLQESLDSYDPYFYGFEAVPAGRVALAYSRSVEGAQTGQVYRVW